MERQLHKQFLQKRSISRSIRRKWLDRHAKIIYAQLYPNRVLKVPSQLTQYKGFCFSNGWFCSFVKRKEISLQVSYYNSFF